VNNHYYLLQSTTYLQSNITKSISLSSKCTKIVCGSRFAPDLIFTALHGMQTRSSDMNSICPSVLLSVKRVLCDKSEERSVHIFIPSFSVVSEKKNDWWGDSFYLKFWVKLTPLDRKRRFSVDIRSFRLSGSTCKKVQLTLIGSPLCAFQ